jgi:hypothetical protein
MNPTQTERNQGGRTADRGPCRSTNNLKN